MPDTRFLTRVVLHDYKSIRYCDLSLPQFACSSARTVPARAIFSMHCDLLRRHF